VVKTKDFAKENLLSLEDMLPDRILPQQEAVHFETLNTVLLAGY